MRSSSLKMVEKLGIKSPKEYRDSLIHEWYIPPEYSHLLEIFFVAKEYGDKLKPQINNGKIILSTREYHITWINSPELIYINKALLSFRYCPHMKIGYVLIKLFHGGIDSWEDHQWLD